MCLHIAGYDVWSHVYASPCVVGYVRFVEYRSLSKLTICVSISKSHAESNNEHGGEFVGLPAGPYMQENHEPVRQDG